MNSQGLSLAMNVCSGSTYEIKGMPAAFYNRECLEKHSTVEEVEAFIRTKSPLGPYHLTLADPNDAKSIHFYQSRQSREEHITRCWKDHQPLSTFNCKYSPNPYSDMEDSFERQERIDEFFKERHERPLEDALSLRRVNNKLTTHRAIMEPETRTFKVAFDNAYAGRIPLQTVPTQELFSTEKPRI